MLRRKARKKINEAGGILVNIRKQGRTPEFIALYPYHTYNFVHFTTSPLPVDQQAAHYYEMARMKYRVYIINSYDTLDHYLAAVIECVRRKQELESGKAKRNG